MAETARPPVVSVATKIARVLCNSMLGLLFIGLLMADLPTAKAQSQVAAEPIVGLRENSPAKYALVGGTVVVQPGKAIKKATVLIEKSSIKAVGKNVKLPAGYQVIDCKGLTIYPGFIDAFSTADIPMPEEKSARHWNANVTPEIKAASLAVANVGDVKQLHSQGITARVVAPSGGIIKGSSSVVLTLDDGGQAMLAPMAWNHVTLTVPRQRRAVRYPNSPMGATALVRQTFYDAQWYESAWQAYQSKPTLPQPETNVSLQRLVDAMPNEWFVFDAANERMALRSDTVAKEFSLKAILRGSGHEYRDLESIAETGCPVLVSLDFPNKPDVTTASDARNVDLRDLLHWDLAPSNAARLVRAGVTICLTTDQLDSPRDFLKQVRVAVEHGLDPVDALKAMTTTPAKLLSIEDRVGAIKPGLLANLVITDGDLFDKQTKVVQTWVAGQDFDINKQPDDDLLVGKWNVKFATAEKKFAAVLEITGEGGKLKGQFNFTPPPAKKEKKADKKVEKEKESPKQKKKKRKRKDAKDDDKKQSESEPAKTVETKIAKLAKVSRQDDRMTAQVRLSELNNELPSGIASMTLVTLVDGEKLSVLGKLSLPSGQVVTLDVSPEDAKKKKGAEEPKADSGEEKPKDKPKANVVKSDPSPPMYPLGAFGLEKPVAPTATVLFRGATVWTCEKQGVLKEADILVRNGIIKAIGESLKAPKNCVVVDASGKHISPGLIDCHSHMGSDGGINESGQVVTAEVRIGDFVNNTDINIYRQLAGGLTAANVLHGSANPIGGQNQVIKLRWGQSMEGMRMSEAPLGIKFALGENVKRSTSRYPNTRMGVQQIFRDQFLAAREYDAAWRRWRAGKRDRLPPRIDLQLQTIAEIQRGERWIHCHSYRQDEITATLDVLEEFGVRIGTLQHILEGYKVADRMAKHGAMASAFSDWWAYKFEVYDAIPYNGALMHNQGIVVSFNSDDRELARRMNTEATKAAKYGGVSEPEALKFVTLNPAKQLRIDQHVGSLKPGKHADLVIWSGPPLSNLSRCEQTWINGRKYFDLETDAELRARDAKLHAHLVQKVLDGKNAASKTVKKDKPIAEEDRWMRHDIYCGAHGSNGHIHTQWERRR